MGVASPSAMPLELVYDPSARIRNSKQSSQFKPRITQLPEQNSCRPTFQQAGTLVATSHTLSTICHVCSLHKDDQSGEPFVFMVSDHDRRQPGVGVTMSRWYFPVRKPQASGDQAMNAMFSESQQGITSHSAWRHSMLYCDCMHTTGWKGRTESALESQVECQ
jgi:hypothetical protein